MTLSIGMPNSSGVRGSMSLTDVGQVKNDLSSSRWTRITNEETGSRWKSVYEKEYIPPTYSEFPPGLTNYEIDQFLREQRLDELIYKLQLGEIEYGSPDIREPSPPPVYDKNGSRINTREVRARKNMEEELTNLIEYMSENVEGYVVPKDYKPLKKTKKLIIPLDKYPDYNFMGLIIGPRGYNHRRLESESGTQISIRGKGTTKEGKKCDHQTEEELAMPMHIHITAESQYTLDKAVNMIKPLLDPFHPLHEEYKRDGLQQLAIINGTLNPNIGNNNSSNNNNLVNTFSGGTHINISNGCLHCGSTQHPTYACPDVNSMISYKRPDIKCSICGDKGHVTMDCKQYVPNNDAEEEFKKMMHELGHTTTVVGNDNRNFKLESQEESSFYENANYDNDNINPNDNNPNGDYYENSYTNGDSLSNDLQNSQHINLYHGNMLVNRIPITYNDSNFRYIDNNADDDDNMDESD